MIAADRVEYVNLRGGRPAWAVFFRVDGKIARVIVKGTA